MTKMFRLVENEFIKSYKKISTIVLLVMVVVISFGYTLISYINVEEEKSWNLNAEVEKPNYEQLISDAKLEGFPGYELQIEMYEFMDKNKVSWGWRYDACELAFSYEEKYVADEDGNVSDQPEMEYTYDEDTRNKMLSVVENNDWKTYCQYMIDEQKAMGMHKDLYWEYQYRLDNNIPFPDGIVEDEDYINILISDIAVIKATLHEGGLTNEEAFEYKNELKIGLYRLENEIELNVADYYGDKWPPLNIWVCLANSPVILTMVGLLVAVIAGSIISNEYSQGTIKFLLINPVKRWKILIAKYITCIITSYGFILICYAAVILTSMIFFGASDIGADYIKIVNNEIVTTSGLLHVLKAYIGKSVEMVIAVTLAVAVSSLTKSSALSTGLSVYTLISGETTIIILAELKQDWGRYLVWANTDLIGISQGNSYFPNHSLGFAITVLAVHMVVFGLIAWDGFTKREV